MHIVYAAVPLLLVVLSTTTALPAPPLTATLAFAVSQSGADTPSCGFAAAPCASLGYAFNLSRKSYPSVSHIRIDFAPGTHTNAHNCAFAPTHAQLAGVFLLSLGCAADAAADAACATVDCAGSPFFARLSHPQETKFQLLLVLDSLTVANAGSALPPPAQAAGDVGGVWAEWPTVVSATHVAFVGNVGRLAGGMWIASAAATPAHTLERVTFVGNSVAEAATPAFPSAGAALVSGGGGLRVGGDGVATVVLATNVTLRANTAASGGGAAVFGPSSVLRLVGAVVADNVAAFGGGVYTENVASGELGGAAFDAVDVSGNSALVGGGLAVLGGSGLVAASRIVNNTASVYGGALYIAYAGVVNASDSVLTGNTAGLRGGGLFSAYAGGSVLASSTLANTVVAPPSALENAGTDVYLVHTLGIAAFPHSRLAGSLYCDASTQLQACVPCYADTCDVCYARNTGCVGSGADGAFLCPTLNPAFFADNAVTGAPGSLQTCSCFAADTACSGNGWCWWDFTDAGYCSCAAAYMGAKCSFPRRIALVFAAAFVAIVGAGCSAMCFLNWNVRRRRDALLAQRAYAALN